MKQVIGIDLGGTAIKLGLYLSDGTCQKSIAIPTPQPSFPETVIKAIAAAINQLDRDKQALAIGIGTPGPVDATGRIAKILINFDGWRDVPLAEMLEAQTGLPAIAANDANCAGLGEAWLGAGRNYRHFILLTLVTGVGGAIIIDGKLFVGHFGAAGELGLITFNPDGPPCNSGNQGSLEQYLSVRAIRRRTGKDPAELGNLARSGDSQALKFWQEYGKDLGAGLASSIYILTPEAVAIGGGISASAEFFLPAAKAEVDRRVLANCRLGLEILPAELGNQAGMLGAAKLAIERYGND
ncbi:MAG: ROK family protein [Prochloraceae cyanobacterium]